VAAVLACQEQAADSCKYARPAILRTLIGSVSMNAFAFAAAASNPWMIAAAVTLRVGNLGAHFHDGENT
jgi:hypothetical protein